MEGLAYCESNDSVENEIKEAADTVAVTFGPNGGSVLFRLQEGVAYPQILRDGVKTLMQYINARPYSTGARILADACNRTVKKAGDGTTTTAILTSAFLDNWEEVNLDDFLVKGKKATKDQFYQAANISGNGRPESKLVADLIWELGEHAYIVPVSNIGSKTRIEIKEGYVTPGGLYSPDFMNRCPHVEYTHNSVVLKKPYVMLVHDAIAGDQQMALVIRKYMDMNTDRPLVIFGTEIAKQAIKAVVDNLSPKTWNGGSHQGLPIFLAAGWKDAYSFEDIKEATGATVFSQSTKFLFPVKGCSLEINDLGEAEEIELTISSQGQQGYSRIKLKDSGVIDKLIANLKAQITPENETDIEERLSKLSKGVGFIHIGGDTETEHRLIADSIEDCVISSISVLKEGVVSGGAYAFLGIANKAYEKGLHKFEQAVYSVRKKLLSSMDVDENEMVYNFRTKEFKNPDEADIWESAAVVNESLKSAYSLVREIKNVKRVI